MKLGLCSTECIKCKAPLSVLSFLSVPCICPRCYKEPKFTIQAVKDLGDVPTMRILHKLLESEALYYAQKLFKEKRFYDE